MEALASQKMRKNRNSYVKTLDSFFDLRPQKTRSEAVETRLGQMRVILFLEDLGPVDVYKQAEERINREILENTEEAPRIEAAPTEAEGPGEAPGIGLDSRGSGNWQSSRRRSSGNWICGRRSGRASFSWNSRSRS